MTPFYFLMSARLFLNPEKVEVIKSTFFSLKLKGVFGRLRKRLAIMNCLCRHDGLIILATNRPYDLDEAMHRRIMVAIEFRPPDHLLRKAIWESHMPEQMTLAGDIDLVSLTYCSGCKYICCLALCYMPL